ncbi:uncharacterized protein LOC134539270 [Bacillus rossius redtenbacheri]|uniref:uncharacterized protein LOC134539270 n=1 Tax=Bacillus rossius redtenbacheri TaxID=93214 RepID=UPI002FDDDC7E
MADRHSKKKACLCMPRGCEEELGGLPNQEEPSSREEAISWSGGFTRAEDATRPGGLPNEREPDRLETPSRREVVSWLGGGGPACVEQAVADAAAEDSEDEERALDRLLLACEDRRRARPRSPARRAAATPVVVERAIGDNMASTFLFGLRVVDFGPARTLDIPHSAVTRAPRLERSRHVPCRTPHRMREAWTWSSQAREEAELRRLRINTFRQAIENLRHRHRRAPPPCDVFPPPSRLLQARDSLEVMLARSRRTDADDESSDDDTPPARQRRYSRDRPDRPRHSDSDCSDSTSEQQVMVRPPPLLGTPDSVSKCSSDREDDSDDDPPASPTEAPGFLPLRVTKYRAQEDLSGSSKPIRKKVKIQFGKRMHARKRKLATSHVQNSSLSSANVGRSNSDSPQECTEIKPEPTNSETSDGKSVEMTNNESSFDSLSGVVSKTESTTVNWPSDGEDEEKADERITELSSEHEIVQVLYKDIPRELSVKSVTTESEGNPSTASLEAQIPVLSVGAIECHSVSGKVDINRQAKLGTSESASDLVAAGSCDKEALGHPEERDVPRRAKQGAKCQDEDTVMFMWPSYVMVRMTKSSVKVHTSADPGGSAEHVIIRNPECVVVKSPQSSSRVGRRSTEAIYVNSRTDTRAGATDTDDEDTAPRVSRHPRPEA